MVANNISEELQRIDLLVDNCGGLSVCGRLQEIHRIQLQA